MGLRIPELVDEAKISTGNEPIHPIKKQFYRFSGTWTDKTVIHVELHSEFRLVKRPNNLYAVVKGPLVFSMPVNEEKRFLDGNDYPYSEYELIPADSWNYAICIDDKDRFAHSLTFEEKNITNTPFSPLTPPLEMYTYGRKIQWPLRKNSAAPNPFSVAVSDKKEMLRFIPVSYTHLQQHESVL